MSGRLYCDRCKEWILPLHGVTALYERDAWWCAKHCRLTADGHVDFPSEGRLVPETIMTSDQNGEFEPLSDSQLRTMRRGCDSEMDAALDEIAHLRVENQELKNENEYLKAEVLTWQKMWTDLAAKCKLNGRLENEGQPIWRAPP